MEVAAADWDAIVGRLGVTDVYYSRGFVEASAPLAGGAPAYLHLGSAGGDVLFPVLVRDNPVDVVTPYGYGGPVGLGVAPPVEEFAAAYAQWCAERGAVSSFVVFHPLFANHRDPFGFHVTALGGTVAWPLVVDDLPAEMHRHHRRLVRRAVEAGAVATVTTGPERLPSFVEVYEATMRRNDASAFYLFDERYWKALADGVPLVQVDVHAASGELLAAVVGMGAPPWLHYHLGGQTDAGRGTGASHLALYELASWGREHEFEVLHLGGGVGGRADSLLEFKRRFAPVGLRASAVGKAVHDAATYERLAGAPPGFEGFFPAYRAPR